MRAYITDGARFLLASGLLGEINRKVLHPRGLALVVHEEADGSCSFARELLDMRGDPTGIEFSEEVLETLAKKLETAPAVDEFRKAMYPPCGVQPLDEEKEARGEREDC